MISFFFQFFFFLSSQIFPQKEKYRRDQNKQKTEQTKIQHRRSKKIQKNRKVGRKDRSYWLGKFYWPLCGRSFSMNLPLLPLNHHRRSGAFKCHFKINENNNLPYISLDIRIFHAGLLFFFQIFHKFHCNLKIVQLHKKKKKNREPRFSIESRKSISICNLTQRCFYFIFFIFQITFAPLALISQSDKEKSKWLAIYEQRKNETSKIKKENKPKYPEKQLCRNDNK